MAGLTLIADSWYPRYLFFVTPALCLLMGHLTWTAIRVLRSRLQTGRASILLAGMVLMGLGPALSQDLTLVRHPAQARLPLVDRRQYIEGPAAGYGFPEAARWITTSAPPQVVCLWVGDYMQLRTYLPAEIPTRVVQLHVIKGQAQTVDQRLGRLAEMLQQQEPLYILLSDTKDDLLTHMANLGLQPHLISAFPRPGGKSAAGIFRVTR